MSHRVEVAPGFSGRDCDDQPRAFRSDAGCLVPSLSGCAALLLCSVPSGNVLLVWQARGEKKFAKCGHERSRKAAINVVPVLQ